LAKCKREVSKRQMALRKEVTPPQTPEKSIPKPETTVTPTQKTEAAKEAISPKVIDFALVGIDGKQVKLSDLRGRVVMLYFWALWRGDNADKSMQQIQHFIDIYKKYRDKDFEMIGIVVDENDADTIKSFRDTYDVNFRLLIGDESVAKSFGEVKSAPVTLVIDKEGNTYSKHLGYKGKYTYEADVRLLLSK